MRDLTAAAREIVEERGKQYGPARETAKRFAVLASAVLGTGVEPEHYPRLMIAAKIARDPKVLLEDTELDIAGYELILESMQREGEG